MLSAMPHRDDDARQNSSLLAGHGPSEERADRAVWAPVRRQRLHLLGQEVHAAPAVSIVPLVIERLRRIDGVNHGM